MIKPILASRLNWKDIDPEHVQKIIRLAREEDLWGAGLARRPESSEDITTATFPPCGNENSQATLAARQPLTICGLQLVPLILEAYGGATFETLLKDGDSAQIGDKIGVLTGPPAKLLTAERVLLNFLQHLSGIATSTAVYVRALGNSTTRLLDTRKTTPGYRTLEKYAVVCGGGWNHRIGLWDRVLIKDNHLDAFRAKQGDALREAVQLARKRNPGTGIEVEVDHIHQIPPVLDAGADCILLDNFTPDEVKEAVKLVNGRSSTEASGGIDLRNIGDYAHAGLDFISTGAPVHQSTWVDIGLDWQTST